MVSLLASFPIANKVVTKTYMEDGRDIVRMMDGKENTIAETATDKTEELYLTCKEAALNGNEEVMITAEKVVYVSSFECEGENYTISAYSHINQVSETLASEYFLFSVLILTSALIVFLTFYLIIGKKIYVSIN